MAQLLGLRQLAQAAITLLDATPAWLVAGAEIDLAHASSMLALAAIDRRQARVALLDAAGAGMFAAMAVMRARLASAAPAATAPPGHPRLARLVTLRDQAAIRIVQHTLPARARQWLARDRHR